MQLLTFQDVVEQTRHAHARSLAAPQYVSVDDVDLMNALALAYTALRECNRDDGSADSRWLKAATDHIARVIRELTSRTS